MEVGVRLLVEAAGPKWKERNLLQVPGNVNQDVNLT